MALAARPASAPPMRWPSPALKQACGAGATPGDGGHGGRTLEAVDSSAVVDGNVRRRGIVRATHAGVVGRKLNCALVATGQQDENGSEARAIRERAYEY
jgi:hypothetical protein